MSDKARTLRELSDQDAENYGEFLGKLRITYTDTTITTELEEFAEELPYSVVGQDEVSVVIRSDAPPAPELDVLELSRFTRIQFDGNNTYWVVAEFGTFREYFRRVKNPDTQK